MPLALTPPSSDIEIISMACVLCGKQGFNTVDGGGPLALDAQRFLGPLVSAQLGSNRWKFALTNRSLGILTTLSPAFEEWNYFWDMPDDLLMLHNLDPLIDYAIHGRRILTRSQSVITATYSKNVPVSMWPPAFSMYIVYSLAGVIGASVANSDRLLGRLIAEGKSWESRALFADGQSSPGRPATHANWITARFGRGGR